MIKLCFLSMTLFIVSLSALGADLEISKRIETINSLKDKSKTLTELLKLKKDNQIFKKKLLQEKSYKVDSFHTTLVLESVLENISLKPVKCSSIRDSILLSYKKKWNDLPSPIHHVWVAIEKVCEK